MNFGYFSFQIPCKYRRYSRSLFSSIFDFQKLKRVILEQKKGIYPKAYTLVKIILMLFHHLINLSYKIVENHIDSLMLF